MSVKRAIVDFVLKDPREKSCLELLDESRPEDFLHIRKSTPSWHKSYTEACSTIKQTILCTSPNVSEIVQLWHKFRTFRFIEADIILQRNSPFELRGFKSFIQQRLEKSLEKMLNTYNLTLTKSWYPSILNIFYTGSKRNEWTSIPNSQIESFFKLVSLIISDQIRQAIRETALDFVSMFDLLETCKRFPNVNNAKPVQFTIRPVLDDKLIRFEPMTSEIETTIVSLLDSIFLAAEKIPKIETQLFATNQSSQAANQSNRVVGMNPVTPDQFLQINFEQTYPSFCESARKQLKDNLSKLLQAPHNYLSEFEKHSSIIEKRADFEIQEFIKNVNNQEKMIEEAKKFRNIAINQILISYPFSVHFPLIDLECGDFIKELSDRAMNLGNLIIEKISSEIRSENEALITSFEEMAKILTKIPTNVEEMVHLRKYLETARITTLKQLEDSVEEAKKKYIIID